jgi:hypothetical protein
MPILEGMQCAGRGAMTLGAPWVYAFIVCVCSTYVVCGNESSLWLCVTASCYGRLSLSLIIFGQQAATGKRRYGPSVAPSLTPCGLRLYRCQMVIGEDWSLKVVLYSKWLFDTNLICFSTLQLESNPYRQSGIKWLKQIVEITIVVILKKH